MAVKDHERVPAESGWVRIDCSDPWISLNALLGPDSPRISSGDGGWEVIDVPRQVGMIQWSSSEPYQLQFSLLLDGGKLGFKEGRSSLNKGYGVHEWQTQEPFIKQLYAVARGTGEEGDRPGVCRIQGIPYLPARNWVIETIEEQEGAVRRTSDMHRIRAVFAITLREYRPPTYKRLKRHALQGPVGPKGTQGKTVVIKVKAEDTPAKIAKRRHCKWTDIRRLNPGVVKKANQHPHKGNKIRVGAKLRVPVTKRRGRDKD